MLGVSTLGSGMLSGFHIFWISSNISVMDGSLLMGISSGRRS
jgi:hypothetical protein